MDQAMQQALRSYVAAWSEGDQVKRDELLERSFAADGLVRRIVAFAGPMPAAT